MSSRCERISLFAMAAGFVFISGSIVMMHAPTIIERWHRVGNVSSSYHVDRVEVEFTQLIKREIAWYEAEVKRYDDIVEKMSKDKQPLAIQISTDVYRKRRDDLYRQLIQLRSVARLDFEAMGDRENDRFEQEQRRNDQFLRRGDASHKPIITPLEGAR